MKRKRVMYRGGKDNHDLLIVEENMDHFKDYLASIDHPEHRNRTEEMLTWISVEFPELVPHIKWNTPMFSNQDTFIIGVSTAKHYLSVSPEEAGISRFADEIAQAGYSATKGLFRIPWNKPVDYKLLERMIWFNIEDKKGYKKFWR